MNDNNKEIRFTQKKVDESWKEQAWRDKEKYSDPAKPSSAAPPQSKPSSPSTPKPRTSKAFMNFLSSLGLQSLIHLGEMAHPETHTKEVNVEAAREIIDLLVQLKEKTQGNLSAEESEFLEGLLPELQMKFAQKV